MKPDQQHPAGATAASNGAGPQVASRAWHRFKAGSEIPSPPQPRSSTEAQDADTRARRWHAPAGKKRPRRVWREHATVRAADLASGAIWHSSRTDGPSSASAGWAADADADVALRSRLNRAVDAAEGRSFSPWTRRARLERAIGCLDSAEVLLLQRASPAWLTGQLPRIHAHVRAHLPPGDPERLAVEAVVAARARDVAGAPDAAEMPAPLTDTERSALLSAIGAASAAARREHIRLRSFRNIVVMTTVALTLLAGGFALLGYRNASWTPLCFAPQGMETVVCPTTSADLPNDEVTDVPPTVAETARTVADTAEGHDVAVVMLVGLGAAAVTGAVTLRSIRGTSTPYAVPTALIALKLPTGALTAFFGLLLINGGFIPGLSALDTSGQILAWAVVFGAAQHLVTRLVDRKAQDVLDSVGSTPMTADKE
jgi:hypothetical protein